MKIEDIARVCYEANAAYCRGLGDNSFGPWEVAPDWQRSTVIKGVEFTRDNPGASHSASHDSWLAEKTRTGWKYGPVKDVGKKEHPCVVPFDQLPEEQKLKDVLFQGVVRALLPSLTA